MDFTTVEKYLQDCNIKINASGLLAWLRRALSKMPEIQYGVYAHEVISYQYRCVYFRILKGPAMFKPLSYSSGLVSIR